MVRRFFGWFLGIVLLVALVGYGWLVYRQHRSFDSPIHSKAETLIRVKVDGLVKTLLGNVTGNLGYYRQRWKSERGPGFLDKAEGSGLRVPANVFLYAVAGVPNTWFSSLEISDAVAFKSFLRDRWGMELIQEGPGGVSRVISKDGRWLVVFTAGRVVLAMAYRTVRDAAGKVCLDILAGRATIPVSESPFYEEGQADKHHVLWSASDLSASLQFENGTVAVEASIRGGLVKGVDSLRPKRFKDNSLLKTWLDADIQRLVDRYADVLASKGIPADSVNRYYGGYMAAEWMDSTLVQRDTVVSYGYNDNFEKTEQHTVRQDTVPEVYLGLKASPHLLGYLPPRLVYQLRSGHQGDLLFAGTGSRFSDERLPDLTNDFFYFYADLARLLKVIPASVMPASTRVMKELEVHARQNGDAVELKGRLSLLLNEINSLAQLFL